MQRPLLIAGYLPSLAEYFDFKEDDKDQVYALTKAYAKLTTGQEDGEHDMLISTKRQLCRTGSFNNLSKSKDDPVYPFNVEKYISENGVHCLNLMSIFSDFLLKDGELLVEVEETIDRVTEFLAKHNQLTTVSIHPCGSNLLSIQ